MRTIGILVFDDVEELDFVGPLEVFGTAARFGGDCRAIVIAEFRSPVRCRNGLVVVPERAIDDVGRLDLLLVPGGLGARTHARENALTLVAQWFGEPLAVQVAENMEWQSAAWRSGQ